MKAPKALKLKSKGKSSHNLHFRASLGEKLNFLQALEKLNSLSPLLIFNLSDFLKMSAQDLSERILSEEITFVLDIPARRIIFDLSKTKRGGIE